MATRVAASCPVPSTFCSSPTKKLAATLRGESPRPWRNERLRAGARAFLRTTRRRENRAQGRRRIPRQSYGKASHAGLDFEKGVTPFANWRGRLKNLRLHRSEKRFDRERWHRQRRLAHQCGSRRSCGADRCAHCALKDAAGIEKKMRGLRAFNRKCKIEISGGMNRPPMERTAGVARSTRRPKPLPANWDGTWRSGVGGGSDGNFTAGWASLRSTVLGRGRRRARHP